MVLKEVIPALSRTLSAGDVNGILNSMIVVSAVLVVGAFIFLFIKSRHKDGDQTSKKNK